MNERTVYNDLIIVWFILAAAVFVTLFFFVAPYGRHIRKGWGPSINDTLGWVVMEAGSPLIFAACFLAGTGLVSIVTIIFFALWEALYVHRAFIYPFTHRGAAESMSLPSDLDAPFCKRGGKVRLPKAGKQDAGM